ncbi:protein VAPYRIN-LIKE-like [Rutidosis leptorrhynchoides]|uniref:protein VAPYRIN-LIKE-like n=1 Tax=Rutidosis leptorrhynchoides TaxID=125765 RepID=UPI003A99927C
MDRLVKADVKEINLVFTKNQKCSTTCRLTNLMHTMSVAVSLNTTNPSTLSFTQSYSIIPPLGNKSFTILSKPYDHPPIGTPPDNVLVRSSMLPTGKASQEDLQRLFYRPGPHIFKDVTIPISFVGPHVVEYLISSSVVKTLETAFVLSKAILWCDESELTSLLKPAAMSGSSYVVSSLLDSGADVNKRDLDNDSVIYLAVKSGDIDTIRVVVESGCEVDQENDRLLHVAASMNRVDIMEVLCMGYLDLDVNQVDSKGQTPLHIGASYGYVEVLEFLITLGCDPNLVDHSGWSSVHWASWNGHLDAVEVLLSASTYVKYAVNKEGKTAYSLAVEKGHSDLYDVLHLGDVLHRCARKGDVEEMRKCLREGANVNGKDQNGWTPLHRSAFKGHMDCVKVLLSYGARVDLVDGCGYTALHRAVEVGNAQVAMVLIANGAKANMKSFVVPIELELFKKYPSVAVEKA